MRQPPRSVYDIEPQHLRAFVCFYGKESSTVRAGLGIVIPPSVAESAAKLTEECGMLHQIFLRKRPHRGLFQRPQRDKSKRPFRHSGQNCHNPAKIRPNFAPDKQKQPAPPWKVPKFAKIPSAPSPPSARSEAHPIKTPPERQLPPPPKAKLDIVENNSVAHLAVGRKFRKFA